MVTLHECADAVGIAKDEAYRLASCFGIGMMQGSICGAVTAAFIAIGRRFGNTEPGNLDQKGLLLAKREEFITEFKNRFGGDVTCPGILGIDLREQEGMRKAIETGITMTLCPKICRQAADIVNGMIQ
jgi:C_GCAxxG_C_C family probable redox protein